MKKNKPYWVGVDIGGTKMMSAVFDKDFKILARKRRKTKSQEGMEACLERLIRTVKQSLDEASVKVSQVAGIGVGSPGPLDVKEGVVLDTPNLGWKNAPLKKTLEKTFSCPVVVINDVDSGVYGEYTYGAAKDARCMVGVFPGTGIGGGCVYEGTIIQGERLSAMEFGHIPVMPEGPLCGCGQRGCIEALASRLAISQAVAAAAYRSEAPYILKHAGTDLSNIRSRILAEAIANGDTVVEDIVRNASRWLGKGVAIMVNLMAPDCVVLGGGLVEAMPDIFQKEVLETAKKNVMTPFVDTFTVKVAKLGDDSSVTGAAAWAKKVYGD